MRSSRNATALACAAASREIGEGALARSRRVTPRRRLASRRSGGVFATPTVPVELLRERARAAPRGRAPRARCGRSRGRRRSGGRSRGRGRPAGRRAGSRGPAGRGRPPAEDARRGSSRRRARSRASRRRRRGRAARAPGRARDAARGAPEERRRGSPRRACGPARGPRAPRARVSISTRVAEARSDGVRLRAREGEAPEAAAGERAVQPPGAERAGAAPPRAGAASRRAAARGPPRPRLCSALPRPTREEIMTAFPAPRRIALAARRLPTAARSAPITLSVHEAGSGPAVVFCHGFPELAYSWRHQLPALAAAGFRAIAPDQRGYGASDRPEAIAGLRHPPPDRGPRRPARRPRHRARGVRGARLGRARGVAAGRAAPGAGGGGRRREHAEPAARADEAHPDDAHARERPGREDVHPLVPAAGRRRRRARREHAPRLREAAARRRLARGGRPRARRRWASSPAT